MVLLPSFAQANAYRRAHAGDALFAATVTTFDAWIADLWELYGDGRSLISPVYRAVAMVGAFQGAAGALQQASYGFAEAAATCVRDAAGVPAFEEALDAVDDAAFAAQHGVTANEQEFLRAIARYRANIAQRGFVEPGEATALLAAASSEVFPQGAQVHFVDAAPLTWRQRFFFEQCEGVQVQVSLAEGAAGVQAAPEGCDVSFAFASGAYAQPALLADVVRSQLQGARVAIACANPLETFQAVAPVLVSEGFSCAVQALVPFAQTAFGKAYFAMAECVQGEAFDAARLSDVLLSPFSGIAQSDAFKIDAQLKQDRLASKQACFQQLRAASEPFSQLEEIASDPDADILLGVFENMVHTQTAQGGLFQAQQLGAIKALRDVCEAARAFGLDAQHCIDVLASAGSSVSVCASALGGECSFEAAPAAEVVGAESASAEAAAAHDACASEPLVVIGTQDSIAALGAALFDALVLADMNSESYPVADKDNACSVLLEKLGLEQTDSALAKARRTFARLQKVPRTSLIIQRATHDLKAEETYPCVVLEEFLDAQRAAHGVAAPDEPAQARLSQEGKSAFSRGEEDLYANAALSRAGAPQEAQELAPAGAMGKLCECEREKVLLPRYLDGKPFVSPSPSQIETYLECPYRWFSAGRLRTAQLEEGFGPLERGTFAHAAFERFYRAFQEQGFKKVKPDNLPQARVLMAQVLDALEREQYAAEPGSGRLVAASKIEQQEVESLKRQLLGFLDIEAVLLPGFAPRYFEYRFGLPGDSEADAHVRYAGHWLVGTADRIDVDEAGHAVIIDYKGSLTAEHDIAGKDALHAGKVQTRIYAQAVRRALNVDVVGALYVSYGKRHGISGAYNPLVLDKAVLPGIAAKKTACAQKDPKDLKREGFLRALVPAARGTAGGDARGEAAPAKPTLQFADFTFASMLDATEDLVAQAIKAMGQGDIAPHPVTADSCTYCPVTTCVERRA